jgi:hypothetical protein
MVPLVLGEDATLAARLGIALATLKVVLPQHLVEADGGIELLEEGIHLEY